MNTDSFKDQILDKIKFIFDKNAAMQKLTETIKQNELAKKINDLNIEDAIGETKKAEMDEILNTMNRENNIDLIFKKTKMLFNVIGDLIKFSILKVDDPEYQKIESEKIICPENTDKLILIMGVYNKAFDKDMEEILYRIVNIPYYSDLYKISCINLLMIPFVADDKIDSEKLKIDYEKFSEIVKNLVCDVLKVNTDFEEDSLFE